MKTLVLMRHGHADRGSSDHDRTLTLQGKVVSRRSAEQLLAAGIRPDCVLVSDARRTVETEDTVRQVIGSPEPSPDATLYLASAETCSAAVAAVANSRQCILLIAHNPGLSELASRLQGAAVGLSPGEYATVRKNVRLWSQFVG